MREAGVASVGTSDWNDRPCKSDGTANVNFTTQTGFASTLAEPSRRAETVRAMTTTTPFTPDALESWGEANEGYEGRLADASLQVHKR
jgi:hypothetical protein